MRCSREPPRRVGSGARVTLDFGLEISAMLAHLLFGLPHHRVRGNVLLKPSDYTSRIVYQSRKCSNAVTLLGISHKERFYVVLEKRIMELHGLFRRGTAVECTANIERRRLHLVGMHDGAAMEIFPTRIVVLVIEKHLHEMWDIADEMLRHHVCDRRYGNRRRETVRLLRNEP